MLSLYPDLSLIRGYTPEDDLAQRPVVVTHFQRDQKSFYYLNAHHVTGIENTTCHTVRQAIRAFKPQLVIVEGLPTEAGPSPNFYIDYANRQAARSFVSGEPAYAAFLAHQNHIPFVGGEPTHTAIVTSMEREGYSVKDIMAFYLLRALPQERREGKPINEAHFAEWSAHYLQQYFSYMPQQERLTIDEFKAWYDSHKADSKHFLEISTGDFAPYASPVGNYFQEFSHRLSRIRDGHLCTLIAEVLSSHDRVLVVYGDGHLVKTHRVFEKMLGQGAIIQLESNRVTAPARFSASKKVARDRAPLQF
jgi:hypothetical protein